MTENQRAMYAGVSICRNTEVAHRWSRTVFFFLIQSAVASFGASRPQPTFTLFFVIGFVGLILTVIWFIANRRTNEWIVYWQSRLAAFERTETGEGEVGVFTGSDWKEMTSSPFTFHAIVNILIIFIAIGWITVIVSGFFL